MPGVFNEEALTKVISDLPTTEPVGIGSLWRDSLGKVTLSVGIPPVFSLQPSSVTCDEGTVVSLTVASNNTTGGQWYQSIGAGAYSIMGGQVATTLNLGAVTFSAHNGTNYKYLASGPGGATFSAVASLTVYATAPLTGIPSDAAISTQYLDSAWQFNARATVRVEKSFTGVFTNLYPHTTGELFTSPGGAGQSATAWAAGSKLLVETPYNQSLASELSAGHPTAITDNTRRVLLDISIPTAPRFAGVAAGAQDPGQHATERGYDLNVSFRLDQPFMGCSVCQLPASGTVEYRPWQNNGGTAWSLNVQPATNRWFTSNVSAVCTNPGLTSGLRLPSVKVSLHTNRAEQSIRYGGYAVNGGVFAACSNNLTHNSTVTPFQVMGGGVSGFALTGYCYGMVFCKGSYHDELMHKYTGTFAKRMHSICRNAYGANEVLVQSPLPYKTTPLAEGASSATMMIKCTSAPGRQIEANYNGAGYLSIGTTDANGDLVGSLPGCLPGIGTLLVRVVGQVTGVVTVLNVPVGPSIARMGQSNADEREDDILLTVQRTIVTNAIANSVATKKSWIWNFLQRAGTRRSAPVQMNGNSAGATYLFFNAGGSTDGRHGHWHPQNPLTTVVSNFNQTMMFLHVSDTEPSALIWHQGEEDANNLGGGTTKAQYKTAFALMLAEFRARTGWASVPCYVMSIGRDGAVPDNQVDQIRYALQELATDGTAMLGGCLAHIDPGDVANVHFKTQATKDLVAAVFERHYLPGGGGRAHRYSSGSKGSTTATLNFTGGSGSLVPGVSPTIGWTCTDGGGAITVTGATASSSQIVLTFNRAISGSVLIKWCSHYSGINCTIRDSDATTPLPPEPFEVTL